MMALRPFSWLKNTKRAQCMSQVRCCSCTSTGVKVLVSMMSRSFIRSSSAASQLSVRMWAAKMPHRALRLRSGLVPKVLHARVRVSVRPACRLWSRAHAIGPCIAGRRGMGL